MMHLAGCIAREESSYMSAQSHSQVVEVTGGWHTAYIVVTSYLCFWGSLLLFVLQGGAAAA
jgi:hypothetical protein